jgi:hypothetical protein
MNISELYENNLYIFPVNRNSCQYNYIDIYIILISVMNSLLSIFSTVFSVFFPTYRTRYICLDTSRVTPNSSANTDKYIDGERGAQ